MRFWLTPASPLNTIVKVRREHAISGNSPHRSDDDRMPIHAGSTRGRRFRGARGRSSPLRRTQAARNRDTYDPLLFHAVDYTTIPRSEGKAEACRQMLFVSRRHWRDLDCPPVRPRRDTALLLGRRGEVSQAVRAGVQLQKHLVVRAKRREPAFVAALVT